MSETRDRIGAAEMRAALTMMLLTAASAASWAQGAGDPERGAQLYESRCGACHSVQADRIGPHHAGIVGRRAGSVPGFDYSQALARAGFVWDTTRLQRWLADPEALVPGQKMGYSVAEARDRQDIVAYLATLKP